MGLWKKVTTFIQACDVFSAPITLRYEEEEDKTTKTGGCFSIVLIVLLGVGFSNSWNALLNKQNINSEVTIIQQTDPDGITLAESEFILAVGFVGINILDSTGRYFDVEITQEARINGTQSASQIINMVQCNRTKWESYGSEFGTIYDRQNLKDFLCFPENQTIRLQGKWASQKFYYIRVHVKECSGSGCRTSTQFNTYLNNFGAFYIDYFYINKLLNPSQINPVQSYFEDKNYNTLSGTIAIDTNIYLSEYQINTDESLWPWTQPTNISGVYVDRTEKEEFIHPVQNGSYAQFHFRKSDQKIMMNRSFRKIDDLLSYLGGLFGLVALAFGYLFRYYNQCCFELQICNQVFKDKQKQRSEFSDDSNPESDDNQPPDDPQEINFNFLVYIKYLFYTLLKKMCPCFQWKSMASFQDRLAETRNQMNIDQILHKITFFSRSCQCIFDEDQIKLLYLQEKFSIKELKDQRVQQRIFEELKKNQAVNAVANIDFLSQVLGSQIQEKQSTKKQKKMSTIFVSYAGTSHHFIFDDKMNLEDDIINALNRNQLKGQKGDQVALRIMEGVRTDILKKYKEEGDHKFRRNIKKQPAQSKEKKKKMSVFMEYMNSEVNIRGPPSQDM